MRMRIAICLVAGFVATTMLPASAGAQLSDTQNAAQAQYPNLDPPEDPAPRAAAPAQAAPAQEPAVESGLPVTGFVAIPLLVTGALLLVVGGVMHVRTRER